MNRFLLIPVLVILLFCSSSYATDVSGNITEDTTWTKANSPYYVASKTDVTFTVTTLSATNLTGTTATFNAKITPNTTTTYYFEYGLHSQSPFGYKYKWETAEKTLQGSSTEVPVSEIVSGLELNTDYFYRVVATNNESTVYGEAESFKITNDSTTGMTMKSQ